VHATHVKRHMHLPEMSVAEYRRRADRNGMVADDPVAAAALDAFLGGSGEIRPAGPTAPPQKPVKRTKSGRPSLEHSRENQQKRAAGGNRAEELIGDLLAACAAADVAWVIKVPTPVVPRRKDGELEIKYKAKAGVDYQGHARGKDPLGPSIPVYMEAKKCGAGRLSLTEVKPHQREILDRALTHRCIALLLVIYGPLRRVYAMPWEIARMHRTLGADELGEWAVLPNEPFLKRWV